MNPHWRRAHVPGLDVNCLQFEEDGDCYVHLEYYYPTTQSVTMQTSYFKQQDNRREEITKEEYKWMLTHPEELCFEMMLL